MIAAIVATSARRAFARGPRGEPGAVSDALRAGPGLTVGRGRVGVEDDLDASARSTGTALTAGWGAPEEVARCASLIRVLDVNRRRSPSSGFARRARCRPGWAPPSDPRRPTCPSGARGTGERSHDLRPRRRGLRGPVGPIHAALRVTLAAGHEHDWSRVLVAVTDLTGEVAVREAEDPARDRRRRGGEPIVITTADGVIEWTMPPSRGSPASPWRRSSVARRTSSNPGCTRRTSTPIVEDGTPPARSGMARWSTAGRTAGYTRR